MCFWCFAVLVRALVMIWPQSPLLLGLTMDLALPGSIHSTEKFLLSVAFPLCEQPQKSSQEWVPTLSKKKGATGVTWVLAIHAAMLWGPTTTAACLPCQQRLPPKHSLCISPAPPWFGSCHIGGAVTISICIFVLGGPVSKPSGARLWLILTELRSPGEASVETTTLCSSHLLAPGFPPKAKHGLDSPYLCLFRHLNGGT